MQHNSKFVSAKLNYRKTSHKIQWFCIPEHFIFCHNHTTFVNLKNCNPPDYMFKLAYEMES